MTIDINRSVITWPHDACRPEKKLSKKPRHLELQEAGLDSPSTPGAMASPADTPLGGLGPGQRFTPPIRPACLVHREQLCDLRTCALVGWCRCRTKQWICNRFLSSPCASTLLSAFYASSSARALSVTAELKCVSAAYACSA